MTDIREKTILIIDDEEVIRQSFSDYLEDMDFRTLTAENGRIGVEMFDREKVDLVLVDLRMPEMDGLEVLAHIKKKSPDTPLIVVSGISSIADAVAALHQGAWDYLLKPVKDLSMLYHAVDIALEKVRLKLENRRYQQDLEQMVADRTKALEEANKHLRTSDNKNKQLNLLMGKLLAPDTFQNKMGIITDGVVKIFDAEFSRIWILMPGDRCDSGCYHAQISEDKPACSSRDKCLHLFASSGCYTHIDGGTHSRLPFGENKIGRIASGDETDIMTNDVTSDLHIEDHNWATDLGLTSFAGYQLLSEDGSPIGVLALFSRNFISPLDNTLLQGLSNSLAHVIQTAKAEEALCESERNLSSMMANTLDGVIKIDKHFRHIFANTSVYDAIGLSPEQYLGKTNEEIGAPEDLSSLLQAKYEKVFLTGKTEIFEICYPTVNKGKRVFQAVVAPEFNDDHEVETIINFLRDITELKQAEQVLRESEKRYRSLIEFSPLGIAITNTEAVIIDANQALASMLGYETEELLGLNLRDLTHPEDLQSEDELINSLLNSAETSFSLEKRYRHKNGNYFWVNITISKAADIAGAGVFIFGFAEDIRNRKQMELEREKLINELQKALAEIKELRGFLPICSNCKKIRDDDGYWQQVEEYIMDRTDAQFSHSICPDCAKKLYPDIYDEILEKKRPKS